MIWALGVLILLAVLYILAWQHDVVPREIIQASTLETPDGKLLITRQYYRATRVPTHKSPSPGPLKKEAVWEVQLPDGRWVDCDGADCLATYERSRK